MRAAHARAIALALPIGGCLTMMSLVVLVCDGGSDCGSHSIRNRMAMNTAGTLCSV